MLESFKVGQKVTCVKPRIFSRHFITLHLYLCLSIVCLLYPIGVKRALRVTISGPNPGGITFSFLITVFVLLYFL